MFIHLLTAIQDNILVIMTINIRYKNKITSKSLKIKADQNFQMFT